MAEQHHLDEGTIHAWLDGALPPDESARVEAHAAKCAECSAMVAEARGLVAASSRILASLDEVPAGVIPGAAGGDQLAALRQRHRATRTPWWRRRSVLAAASVLFVAGMTTVVQLRTPGDAGLARTEVAADAPAALPAESPAATGATGSARESLSVAPQRTESDQAAVASRPQAPPPSPTTAPEARVDREAEAKKTEATADQGRGRLGEVATALADSTGSIRDLAQKSGQVASAAAAREQVATAYGLAPRQQQGQAPPLPQSSGVAANERTRQALVAGAPPALRLGDSSASAALARASANVATPGFDGGCFELSGPPPVGGRLLGVPEHVRLVLRSGAIDARADTSWNPATSPDEFAVRSELAWRLVDPATVELRVRRPLDSTMVAFRVSPVAPPLARGAGGVLVAVATRVVCR